MKFSRLSLNQKPQLPSFEPRVEICSHMRRNTFHCCSGLRRSSPSPALQRRWTYSCDLIRWFPLATRRHKAKQGRRSYSSGASFITIMATVITAHGVLVRWQWVESVAVVVAGTHSLGGRDVRTVLEVMVSVTTNGTSKKKLYSTHSKQVFSACFVFLFVNKNNWYAMLHKHCSIFGMLPDTLTR